MKKDNEGEEMEIQRVILKKTEEQRILEGHPWIFSNEIARFEGQITSGELCDVYSDDKRYIGRGFLNTASKIMVRMLSFEPISIIAGLCLVRPMNYQD